MRMRKNNVNNTVVLSVQHSQKQYLVNLLTYLSHLT